MVGSNGSVIRNGLNGMFHHLDVATGPETRVTLLEKLVPVGNAAEHLTDMDKVKLIGSVGPGQGHIINLEDAIRRDEGGLDGREVNSGYFGAGVLIGHISVLPEIEIVSHSCDDMLLNNKGLVNAHGPDASSGADVEDFLSRGDNG